MSAVVVDTKAPQCVGSAQGDVVQQGGVVQQAYMQPKMLPTVPAYAVTDNQMISQAQKEVRMGFVRKVYGILSFQLLLTVAIAAPFQRLGAEVVQAHAWILWASLGVLIASMCVMMCCSSVLRKFPANYMFLTVFTAAMGVLVGITSAMYTWQSVIVAAGITVAVFLAMTVYAWRTKTDFTGLGPYLFAGLVVLICFGFVLSLLGAFGINIQWLTMLYNVAGVLIFTFYIVYDTQLIIGGNHKVQFGIDDYCFAALSLYLDIINLFLFILSIFGSRN